MTSWSVIIHHATSHFFVISREEEGRRKLGISFELGLLLVADVLAPP
jgi:hypothetical protein